MTGGVVSVGGREGVSAVESGAGIMKVTFEEIIDCRLTPTAITRT